jgi:hypothetical protein
MLALPASVKVRATCFLAFTLTTFLS